MFLSTTDKVNGSDNGTAIAPGYCSYGGRDDYTVAYATMDTLIDITGFLGNLLVLSCVLKFDWLRADITNCFVGSLAASDMLVCLNIPYYASFYFDLPHVCKKYPCLIRYAAMLYSEVVSVLSLASVAVDRYLAVVHALPYCRLAAQHRHLAVGCIVGIYVYVAILVAPVFSSHTWTPEIPECDLVFIVGAGYALLVVVLHVLLGLLLNVGLYACVFRVARRQARSLQHAAAAVVRSLPGEESGSLRGGDGGASTADQRRHHHILRRETRTAVTMVLVLGVHIVTLCPFVVVILLQYLDPAHRLMLSKAKKFVVCLYFAKSSVNPIIFGWKTRDFRRAFKKILHTDRWWPTPDVCRGTGSAAIRNPKTGSVLVERNFGSHVNQQITH